MIAVITPMAGLLLAAGCGDEDDETTRAATEAEAATADVDRYCEVSQELDAAGSAQFEALEQDPNATQKDFEQAEAELVEGNEGLLEEVQQAAPAEIQPDVEALVAGLRVRAGLEESGPTPDELRAAEKRINTFENDNCG